MIKSSSFLYLSAMSLALPATVFIRPSSTPLLTSIRSPYLCRISSIAAKYESKSSWKSKPSSGLIGKSISWWSVRQIFGIPSCIAFWIILSSGAEESLENSECICESQMIISCIPPFIIIALHIIT